MTVGELIKHLQNECEQDNVVIFYVRDLEDTAHEKSFDSSFNSNGLTIIELL